MTAAGPKPDTVLGVGPAPADAEATATSPSALVLRARFERLQELDGSALREDWRRLFRVEPPRISRDLLIRALAYRLQELEFGGLPKWARQSLAGSAAATDLGDAGGAPAPKPAPTRLKPGARLVREWHGRTHTVVALDDDFEFAGRRYRSLTQIAREITGAHWSGPRFFGLVNRKVGAASDSTPAHQDDPEEAGGLAPPGQSVPSIGTRRDIAGAKGANARRRELQVKVNGDGRAES